MAFLQRFVQHLRTRLAVNQVVSDTPASFLATLQQVRCAASRQSSAAKLGLHLRASPRPALPLPLLWFRLPHLPSHFCPPHQPSPHLAACSPTNLRSHRTLPACNGIPLPVLQAVAIEGKTLRFCYDRLASLMKTLEITASDDFGGLHRVADFATLVGTYSRGFAIITEPYDDRLPSVGVGGWVDGWAGGGWVARGARGGLGCASVSEWAGSSSAGASGSGGQRQQYACSCLPPPLPRSPPQLNHSHAPVVSFLPFQLPTPPTLPPYCPLLSPGARSSHPAQLPGCLAGDAPRVCKVPDSRDHQRHPVTHRPVPTHPLLQPRVHLLPQHDADQVGAAAWRRSVPSVRTVLGGAAAGMVHAAYPSRLPTVGSSQPRNKNPRPSSLRCCQRGALPGHTLQAA